VGRETKISWCHHTFSPWLGCSKVSPGCANCYAEAENIRYGRRNLWGPDAIRQRTSEAYWKQPLKWNAAAENAGERRRVFCGSWCDVMEEGAYLDTIRKDDLYELILRTPWLTWLLLTKRPENFSKFLPAEWLKNPRPNVWLGTTAEDQQRADERIPHLLRTPAAVRFLSSEPLLEALRLWRLTALDYHENTIGYETYPLSGMQAIPDCDWPHPKLDLVIVGGESGPRARPCNIAWIRSIVQQCAAAGVACWVKQLGAHIIDRNDVGFEGDAPHSWPMDTRTEDLDSGYQGAPVRVHLRDRKGADMEEWPADLRVRQLPPELERIT